MTRVDRDGTVRSEVAVPPDALAALLADVEGVGRLVWPNLEQRRSQLEGPEPRWVLPPLQTPLRRLDVVLAPTVEPTGAHTSTLTCRSTSDSDVEATLVVHTEVAAADGGSTLTLTWSLEAELSLPPGMGRLASPVVDRAVEQLLDDLAGRAEDELSG